MNFSVGSDGSVVMVGVVLFTGDTGATGVLCITDIGAGAVVGV